jgi:hypothetical protein
MNGNKSVNKLMAMRYIMMTPEYADFSKKYENAFEDVNVKL